MTLRPRVRFCGALLISTLALANHRAVAATANSVEGFYKGKQITMIVAGGVGGAYDAYARAFGQFFGRHIPGNPEIIPKNIPAAGGLQGASQLYNNADHDGLTIGALTSSSTLDALFGAPGAHYDALKLNWLGSIGKLKNVCATWRTVTVKTPEDLQTRSVLMGGSGATSDSAVMPKVLNALLGTKIKIITGYGAGAAIELAVEQGEIEGFCGLAWSTLKSARPAWIRDHSINVILQMGMTKNKELPDVPMAQDYVKDPSKKKVLELILTRQEIGRPIAMPPGVPKERVEALRKAFEATLEDPDFLALADREFMEIDPLTGAEVERFLAKAYASPADIVDQAARLIEPVTTRR